MSMSNLDKRLRELEQRFAETRGTPNERAARTLRRMIEELGADQVLPSGALRALLARYFGPDWLKSPELLDILCMAGLREVIEAVKPEDTARAFTGDCELFMWACAPPRAPDLEACA